jgi:hypothetical protein
MCFSDDYAYNREVLLSTAVDSARQPTDDSKMTVILSKAIQLVSTNTLTKYEKNARIHSEDQITQLVASIREFGFTNPILIDGESGIIAGHGRLEAAKRLGLEKVPVVELTHLTPNQKRAYIIADNKLALNADWDEELLASEIAELSLEEFDIDLIGFSETEINKLLNETASIETESARSPSPNIEAQYIVAVQCKNENEMAQIFEELTERKFSCKLIT